MRKVFRYINSFILAFLFSSTLSYAQTGTISGTVWGADGPLQGVTVSTGDLNVLTNRVGEFQMTLLAGNYQLQISCIGYKNISQELNIKVNEKHSIILFMLVDEKAGEMVLLGSRSLLQQSNIFTAVPVDVVSSKQLIQTSQPSLTQMLQFAVPSFNASRQLVNEPVTLRGLEPDQLLILVNGKRYPNMAFLNWGGVRGMLGRGAVSNDLNAIPFPAIEKIEILKDGASAQYGSDAIAGVINIHLKNSIGKTWTQLHAGQHYKSDGEFINVGINSGLPIGKKGFLNASGAFRFQNPTFRGGFHQGTVYKNYPANANTNDSILTKLEDDSIVSTKKFDRGKVSNAGSSKHTGYTFLLNGGNVLNNKLELFWTASMNNRTTIFTSSYILPKNSGRINPALFPDGFKSQPENHSNDILAIAGIRGETPAHILWEFSSTYGNNSGKYFNTQTNNASQFFLLDKNAPTSFYTGKLSYGQLTNSFHTSKRYVSLNRITNLGFGAEWRKEHFQIKEGEEGSWKNYDTSRRKQGGSGGLVLSPYDAIKESRYVLASYIDVESEYAKKFLINLAARYEYYSDFGKNIAGKLALRYKLTSKISMRSSVSNGFRAPSLQQRYYSHTRIGVPFNGRLLNTGIFRNNSDVSMALGIPSLYAERSINLNWGFSTTAILDFRLTVDAYWIQIKDRIVLSGVFKKDNQDVNSLLHGLTDLDEVQLFVNAINTKTKGIDIVLNRNWKINYTNLAIMLAANFTQTRLFGEIKAAGNLKADSLNTHTLFGRTEKGKLERGQPKDKVILLTQFQMKKISLLLRNTRFGKTSILSNELLNNADEHFSSKILTDFSISYTPAKWLTITTGANNVFDIYPDKLKHYRNTGEGTFIYGQEATPFGINGGFYFMNMQFKF